MPESRRAVSWTKVRLFSAEWHREGFVREGLVIYRRSAGRAMAYAYFSPKAFGSGPLAYLYPATFCAYSIVRDEHGVRWDEVDRAFPKIARAALEAVLCGRVRPEPEERFEV